MGQQRSLLQVCNFANTTLANSDNLVPNFWEQTRDERQAQAPSQLAAELPHSFSARRSS